KHGLFGLVRVCTGEWECQIVYVVGLDLVYVQAGLGLKGQQPGGVFTREDIERRTPMGRFATPDEIARVAVFVASEDASYITGSHITVDGGWVSYGGW